MQAGDWRVIFSVQYFSAVHIGETMACKLILLGGKGNKKDNEKNRKTRKKYNHIKMDIMHANGDVITEVSSE